MIVLLEEPGSIPSSHVAAHNCWWVQFQRGWHPHKDIHAGKMAMEKKGGDSHLNIFSDYSWQSKSGFQGWQDTGVKVLAAVPEALFDSQHPSLAAHKSLWIPILEGQMPSSGPHTRSLVFWVAFSSWVLYPECAPNEISQTALSAVPQSSGFKTLTCRVLIIVTEL